ncbi:MAG: acyl carrier protein [Chloroflexota bacterium]|nr:MAG: acyl carrier protein [Chloroflexota bacterium]
MSDQTISTLTQYINTMLLKRPNASLSPDERLITSGLIDSFHLVDLALFVEDTFGVRIDDTELNAKTFDTLSELSDVIRQRLN